MTMLAGRVVVVLVLVVIVVPSTGLLVDTIVAQGSDIKANA
jgi:hypothetical protein